MSEWIGLLGVLLVPPALYFLWTWAAQAAAKARDGRRG